MSDSPLIRDIEPPADLLAQWQGQVRTMADQPVVDEQDNTASLLAQLRIVADDLARPPRHDGGPKLIAAVSEAREPVMNAPTDFTVDDNHRPRAGYDNEAAAVLAASIAASNDRLSSGVTRLEAVVAVAANTVGGASASNAAMLEELRAQVDILQAGMRQMQTEIAESRTEIRAGATEVGTTRDQFIAAANEIRTHFVSAVGAAEGVNLTLSAEMLPRVDAALREIHSGAATLAAVRAEFAQASNAAQAQFVDAATVLRDAREQFATVANDARTNLVDALDMARTVNAKLSGEALPAVTQIVKDLRERSDAISLELKQQVDQQTKHQTELEAQLQEARARERAAQAREQEAREKETESRATAEQARAKEEEARAAVELARKSEAETRESADAAALQRAIGMLSVLEALDEAMTSLSGRADSASLNRLRHFERQARDMAKLVELEEIATNGAAEPGHHEIAARRIGTAAAGTIVDVRARGYTFRGRVVRPAQVVVSEPATGR